MHLGKADVAKRALLPERLCAMFQVPLFGADWPSCCSVRDVLCLSAITHFRCRDRDRSKRRLFAGIVYHAALINRGKLEVPAKVGSRQSAAREEDNAEVTADLRTRAIASGCG